MKKVKCERCGTTMEFDGDDTFQCPECRAIAYIDSVGDVVFCDEDLSYEVVGETRQCPKCGAYMVPTEDDGWDCPECYHSIPGCYE